MATILRNALLILSILTSSEVWYGVTQAEWEQLEQIDHMLVKNLMDCSSQVPTDLLYLELGILPMRFIAKIRTLLYLHNILQQEENSLLHKFFLTQLKHPTRGDWVSNILNVLQDLNIELDLQEINIYQRINIDNWFRTR